MQGGYFIQLHSYRTVHTDFRYQNEKRYSSGYDELSYIENFYKRNSLALIGSKSFFISVLKMRRFRGQLKKPSCSCYCSYSLIHLLFRFSSSLPEQSCRLRSDGCTTLPDLSSEIVENSDENIIYHLFILLASGTLESGQSHGRWWSRVKRRKRDRRRNTGS